MCGAAKVWNNKDAHGLKIQGVGPLKVLAKIWGGGGGYMDCEGYEGTPYLVFIILLHF
jgi:hypothetical protein